MQIEITWYKDSMKSQVVHLFEDQYKTPEGYFSELFDKFYFHPYQKNKCLLIVALDGDTVAGFQSFFHWPYVKNGKEFNSFQSGNSLVHPGYRGQGIFQKMLAFVDQENKNLGLDFFVGFPIEASIKNLLKDKWLNILSLNWFLKLCNPFGFLPGNMLNVKKISQGLLNDETHLPTDALRLSHSSEFLSWRKNYLSGTGLYYTYYFKKESKEIIFHLKKNKRKIFNEVVIGNILFKNIESRSLLNDALQQLNRDLLKSFSCHFISCAINISGSPAVKKSLEDSGFRKIKNSIYFAVKPFKQESDFVNPVMWEIYRSDIDTW